MAASGRTYKDNKVTLSRADDDQLKYVNHLISQGYAEKGDSLRLESRSESVTKRYKQYFDGINVWKVGVIQRRDGGFSGTFIMNLNETFASGSIDRNLLRLNPSAHMDKARLQACGGCLLPQSDQMRLVFETAAIYCGKRSTEKPVVAHIFEFQWQKADGSLSRPRIVLDAKSGALLDKYDNMQHAAGIGAGADPTVEKETDDGTDADEERESFNQAIKEAMPSIMIAVLTVVILLSDWTLNFMTSTIWNLI